MIVVICMAIITIVSIVAATILEMANHDATEVWKLAGIGLAALAGVLVARRGHENGKPATPAE
jgi:hypothetical protein